MAFEHTVTKLPEENAYPKLVRDGIPEIILANDGQEVPTRVLADNAEFLKYLLKKVVEEAAELSDAESDEHVLEELADIEELVDTILDLKGMTRSELVSVQAEKREKRGGFSKRLLMLEMPASLEDKK